MHTGQDVHSGKYDGKNVERCELEMIFLHFKQRLRSIALLLIPIIQGASSPLLDGFRLGLFPQL